ncbi:hypothetical protein [uncultured Chryseobacterium sp.]|uniref:hypothetical protein n=1 Tax=uncultured Chryseobacterium sp. TaxID=259322 RepID=UPI0025DFE1CE|nr:hypothetical protein [uncultured Chryseobacterium sp.]
MDLTSTLNNFDDALSVLLKDDKHLLEANLSERSIAHRLALYLTGLFPEFDVDCEYNGDVDSDNYRKNLQIDREDIIKLSKKKIDEFDTYSVFPDIIVHKRKFNTDNQLVIEIKKKDSNIEQKKYDLLKLKAFTNQYNYRLGIYLELEIGKNFRTNETLYFQKGQQIDKQELLEF